MSLNSRPSSRIALLCSEASVPLSEPEFPVVPLLLALSVRALCKHSSSSAEDTDRAGSLGEQCSVDYEMAH